MSAVIRQLPALPPFPENTAGLKRGTMLEATHPMVAQLGMKVGDRIAIGFDGEYVRFGPLTWDVEQLADEIAHGVWRIVGALDLNNSRANELFCLTVEHLKIVPDPASTASVPTSA